MPTTVDQSSPVLPKIETFKGLDNASVLRLRKQYGFNTLESKKRNPFISSILGLFKEPMFLLLIVACILYFFIGELTEAIMMMVSVVFVASIEIFQQAKSERALDALQKITRREVRVLRGEVWVSLPSEELVPEDIVSVEEGEIIPADGVVLQRFDLTVDESVLTGESLAVTKIAQTAAQTPEEIAQSTVFQGTIVATGRGVLKVTATGALTEFGKLGHSIEAIDTAPTPLQVQIERFVRQMGIIGVLAFVIVFGLNMWDGNGVMKALLFSLTIAMALIPEEIPVAFSTFMGLGAFRMIKHGILAKQPKTVESLGSATVICLDKTGTITENKMSVAEIFDHSGAAKVLEYAHWASEPEPFDAMEKALEQEIKKQDKTNLRKGFHIIKEYALSGTPPMMTHIWKNNDNQRIIASKGAVERILEVAGADKKLSAEMIAESEKMAAKGYRVLGVASADWDKTAYPEDQSDFDWQFEGLVAFFDPPKAEAEKSFKAFYGAGIRVIMITGDQEATAKNIAEQTGLEGREFAMNGKEVMAQSDAELQESVKKINVFARMFPDAKLRIVNALKANGETVAMSGDGVNDGPALKAANIGVAMGKKGTEIAKGAASLVLLHDSLGSMVTAVRMGRRIYDNLRKAIRYVISIHIPIVLTVLVPLLFGWPYPHILLPLHVIFLELVMDPIAAVAFENEPAERNIMKKAPRRGSAALFTNKELIISIIQGILIAASILVMYRFGIYKGVPENTVRAFVFTTMVAANIFLALANRSFEFPIYKTLFYRNKTFMFILAVSLLLLLLILYVPFLASLFKVNALSIADFGLCALAAFISVFWFELYKMITYKQ